jgi:methionyl-tRNA formyltransferase
MSSNIKLVNRIDLPKIKILFLGYGPEQTSLIDDLACAGCEVWHTAEKIYTTVGFDLVVSHGFRNILKKEVIESSNAPIINLHISYLPWNRGAHPNFWSFYDGTPSGVTIHLIDAGVDTGPVIYQRYVNFVNEENTYSKTYARLIKEIELLFRENLSVIISMKFVTTPQSHKGSYHCAADLPKEFGGWDSDITAEIARLDNIGFNGI